MKFMIEKMEPFQIEAFNTSYQSVEEKNKAIKETRNRYNFRQSKLLVFIKREIKKYSSLGFEFMELKSETINCKTSNGLDYEYNAVPFEISYKNRDLRFVFKPEISSNGSLAYRFSRFTGDTDSFCSGYLHWITEEDNICSHWYLAKNYDTHSLTNTVFDENGMKMLLTNLYRL